MRISNVICVFTMAGVCAFAQQGTSPSQKQQADQNKDQTTTQQKKNQKREQANPFPEEKSQKAQDAANGTGTENASPKGYSSSRVDLKRFAPDANRETRLSNGHGGFIHDPQLAIKDEKVGHFYLQTGDYKGAYDRYKEATEVAPEDGNAVFGLAQAAKGLGQDSEAIMNYTIYLEAIPNGKHSKDARKALKELDSKPKK